MLQSVPAELCCRSGAPLQPEDCEEEPGLAERGDAVQVWHCCKPC